MARPAGYSSDEFSDEDELTLSFDDIPKANSRIEIGRPGNGKGEDRLIQAVQDEDIEVVRNILRTPVNIDYKSSTYSNWTALMHACYSGNYEIVKLLVEHNANTNEHHEMLTPLHCLCDSRSRDEDQLVMCLEALVDYEANIHSLDWCKCSPLVYAARRGQYKLVQQLISLGLDLEAADSEGWTPIFHAVNNGHLRVVKLLKDSGANLKKIDRRGYNLIEKALEKDNKELEEVLGWTETVVDIDKYLEEEISLSNKSGLGWVLSELPDRDRSRLYGYHTDAIRWVYGVGLDSLVDTFIKKEIQLSQILTIEDEQLKQLGVMIAFDRKKIQYCAKMFHEHGWSRNSLIFPPEDEGFDLCKAANCLAIVLQHLHVVNTATYYWKKHQGKRISPKENEYINASIKLIKQIEKEKSDIFKAIQNIEKHDKIVPADLILPGDFLMSSRAIKCKYLFLSVASVFVIGALRSRLLRGFSQICLLLFR